MEVLYSLAFMTRVVFAVYAVIKMVRRHWPAGFGLTLILLTLIVPFSGPTALGLRKLWRRRALA